MEYRARAIARSAILASPSIFRIACTSRASPWSAAPITIPLELDELTLRTIYDSLDGIFLPGGEDIDPVLYAEEPHELLGAVDKERDRTESLLARWALAENKPIMAICRGAQMLNVVAGGSLFQDITALRPQSEKHDYFPPQFERFRLSHEIEVDTSSRLHEIIGGEHAVNSMHHQSVKTLGRNLRRSLGARRGDRSGGGGGSSLCHRPAMAS